MDPGLSLQPMLLTAVPASRIPQTPLGLTVPLNLTVVKVNKREAEAEASYEI